MSLVGLLVTLILMALVATVVFWIINTLAPPEPFRKVILVLCGLILLIWLISLFGAFGPSYRYVVRF